MLDRPRENRSQLVFTRIQGGREGIFWQSARTTRQARPGIRVPRRLAAGQAELTILIDSRERYPYKFTQQQATTQRHAPPHRRLRRRNTMARSSRPWNARASPTSSTA